MGRAMRESGMCSSLASSRSIRWPLVFCLVVSVSAWDVLTRPPDESPPPIIPPGGHEDMLPLPYLGTSVTGAVVSFDASAVRAYDETDKDEIRVDLEGQGPVLFSLPRWNQGDYAPRLQPRRPYSQPNLGKIMPGMVGSRYEQPSDTPTQAWRPSIQKGVILGTVAQNGQKWNDTSPLFYGTVACVYQSHGFGYSMDDGRFSNQDPNIDIAIGKLGLMLEANIDVAVAWFPYHQGWLAGYVDAPGEYSASRAKNRWSLRWSYSPLLPAEASQTVTWDSLGAVLTLPGVDARYDGMVFFTSTNPGPGNNDGNSVSSYINGRSWRVQVREDDQPSAELFCLPDQAMFAFVYIPYSAGGLIGGHMDGSSGVPHVWWGDIVSRRISEGLYHLDIARPGLDYFSAVQPLSNVDGMLLLQVVDHDPSVPRFSRHAVLSYHILPNGTIEVHSHRLERKPGQREAYPFMDTDFYFAWVDFRTPLTPTPETYTGRVALSLHGSAMSSSTFWDGFVFGLGLGAFLLVLLGVLALVASRLSHRSSYLAMAPLAVPPSTSSYGLGSALGLSGNSSSQRESPSEAPSGSSLPAVSRGVASTDVQQGTAKEPLLQDSNHVDKEETQGTT